MENVEGYYALAQLWCRKTIKSHTLFWRVFNLHIRMGFKNVVHL